MSKQRASRPRRPRLRLRSTARASTLCAVQDLIRNARPRPMLTHRNAMPHSPHHSPGSPTAQLRRCPRHLQFRRLSHLHHLAATELPLDPQTLGKPPPQSQILKLIILHRRRRRRKKIAFPKQNVHSLPYFPLPRLPRVHINKVKYASNLDPLMRSTAKIRPAVARACSRKEYLNRPVLEET